MKAWTRTWMFALLVLGLISLHPAAAADGAEIVAPPDSIQVRLFVIEGSHADKPDCPAALQFLKDILGKSFPQFNVFKLLADPEKALSPKAPALFTTGDYTTSAKLLEFITEKGDDGKAVIKAKVQLECKSGDKVLYNPTIKILVGGQHIWAVDTKIFVFHLPPADAPK